MLIFVILILFLLILLGYESRIRNDWLSMSWMIQLYFMRTIHIEFLTLLTICSPDSLLFCGLMFLASICFLVHFLSSPCGSPCIDLFK